MRNSLSILFAVTLFAGTARATEPAPSEQERATPYQQEVRAALTQHAWRITREEAGKLTAERLWLGSGAIATPSLASYARLEITFRANDRVHPVSSARASLCLYDPFRTDHVGTMIYPPLPLRDPKLTQEYRGILAEAESSLAADHRSHAAIRTGGSPGRSNARTVAMR